MGQSCGGFGALRIEIVDHQRPAGKLLGREDAPHPGAPQGFPGALGVTTHPGPGGEGRGPEARAFAACPADGVGHEHRGHTKREPGPLESREALARMRGPHDLVHRVTTGRDTGERFADHPRRPYALEGAAITEGLSASFPMTSRGRQRTMAGR